MTKVTLYSKPDCPLCDDARAALARVRSRAPFELEELDIGSDPVLQATYGERVPVVAIGDEDAFDFVVDEELLERRLAAALLA
jgi:glutaredoxin